MSSYYLGFWIVLILFIIFVFISMIASLVYSFRIPEGHDGIFRILEIVVSHKGATQMDVLVHNVYKNNADLDKLPSYAEILQSVQTVMGSPSFQSDHPWESVAKEIAMQIWNDYAVIGVSVELLVPVVGSTGSMSAASYTRGFASRLLKLDPMN
jgi:hypothetical protein